MEIIVHRESGMWAVHIGANVFPLVPDTGSLFLLVKALGNIYPEATLLLDLKISPNPFVYQRLVVARHWHIAPQYDRIQYALNHPEVKYCGICGHEGWYNSYQNYSANAGGWECWKCGARMHYDGTWFKLSRNARK